MTVPYHSPPSSSSTPSASSSNSRLQPFLLLAQSTRPRGAAAAKLVQQVTEASGVYGFGELLSIPGVPELQDSEHSASFRLFKLFAYGTLSDYKRSPQDYPPLSDAQLEKLRRLSLVSLAMDRRVLAYDLLFEELDIPSRQIRELEDLIIDATYDGLVSGRMDQIQSCFQVESVVGRDVIEDEQLEELFNKLDDW
ncbi:hypothetical protein IE53DRAFT_313822 [Violaceomyces palustris]|uniref:Uncharacterized protein n=1 Tax=Violaceomyces palustris TaxID=1673888 RepID=A0ACD0P023_9BASI|nr:hypothetical protein IE53DRAFT_313822 [Violaceomyces palustris]